MEIIIYNKLSNNNFLTWLRATSLHEDPKGNKSSQFLLLLPYWWCIQRSIIDLMKFLIPKIHNMGCEVACFQILILQYDEQNLVQFLPVDSLTNLIISTTSPPFGSWVGPAVFGGSCTWCSIFDVNFVFSCCSPLACRVVGPFFSL